MFLIHGYAYSLAVTEQADARILWRSKSRRAGLENVPTVDSVICEDDGNDALVR